MLGMAGPYPGLILVAVLMVQAHPDALGWLAVVEGWLLVVGTLGAWLMLSHAGNTENAGNAGDNAESRAPNKTDHWRAFQQMRAQPSVRKA